jgi:dihydroorotate dehydrogenase electron transfer subunit
MIARMPANRIVPLVEREDLGGSHWRLTFRHPEVAREAEPGQFVMIKAGLSPEPPLRRPFSVLVTDPARETFSLFLKVVGPGSRALASLEPGALAQCLGPLGRPFGAPAAGTEALMVAGGYGVAPFRFLGERLLLTGRGGRLFYGGRTAADLPLRPALERLGVMVVPATEDGSLGTRGRVTEPLEAYLEGSPGPVALYACGPEVMMHAVARLSERRGLPAQVSLDPWMGCGVGTCLGCVVRTQRPGEPRPRYRCACTEGPVFDATHVVWPEEREELEGAAAEVRA